VVLPKPGGADTSVSFASNAWLNKRSLRRLRNTPRRVAAAREELGFQ
jgi:hypothetical protein